jgi:hypothetical protein
MGNFSVSNSASKKNRITDKTSKDKFEKQATYLKGDIQYSSRNTETTQIEKGRREETKSPK